MKRTLLLHVRKSPETRLEKLEEKLSIEMHAMEKKLSATFVDVFGSHEHSATVAESESQQSTAKSKKEISNLLNQFDRVFRGEITRMVLAKCIAEQILEKMMKAPLGNGLQGVRDAMEAIIYA